MKKAKNEPIISVPVSLAVTAYGRIHMSKIKQELSNKGINLFYSDTDSVFTDKLFNSTYVGSKLGQLKLENIYKEAVFLCPRVYAGLINEGNEYIKVKGLKAYKYNITSDQIRTDDFFLEGR